MRSKRFLAMLLAFCLVLSAFAPAVSAAQHDTTHVLTPAPAKPDSNKNVSSDKNNSLLATIDKDAATGSALKNLRDDPLMTPVMNDTQSEDRWNISAAIKPDVSLLQTKTPACLEDLKEAAKLYEADDIVRAFVVMEAAPLAQTYNSISLVTASVEKQLLEEQENVINAIERMVLGGGDLEVRYQFTYLTNSFTIETAFANLEKIAYLSGVKSVFVAPTYEPCDTSVSNPNTAASGAMTGVDTVWADLGYTGEGMTIAIIDTGLDLDHPSFSALDEEMVLNNSNYLDRDDITAVLENLNAHSRRGTITAKTLYRSTKVPYAFNYCDDSLTADHSADQQGDHGTHVAGIAAANKTEGTTVVGMAPDAQIVVMKVFGAAGGAYTDDIVAAMEDAMILGCDVVNASLGSPAGFSESGSDEIDAIYARLAGQNIIACISAGNEGPSSYNNMWGTDLNRTNHPDNGTIGSPALYANAFSVASAENCEVMTPFFTLGDGTKVFFNNDSYGVYYGFAPGMAPLIGYEVEYVMVDGLGNPEDYYDAEGNSLVEGKVALVKRGQINFFDKIYNAEMAGAVGCIIVNNVNDDIFTFMMNELLTDEEGNVIGAPGIPACAISMADGDVMAAAEIKTLTVSADMAPRMVEGGQMSSFSSWGVSPDLRLVPDITGIGGNVFSCYDGGKYGLMSGTSMSSPQLAGISALVMQYLQDKYPQAANDGTLANLAMALIMSTADPIIATTSGVEASPRQQGAGLVNAAEAVKAEAFLTVAGGRPKAELGDSKTGKYTFTFQINNISSEAETYTLSSSLLTEDIVDYGIGEYFMAGQDVALTGSVTFNAENNTVTVAPGETVTVTVTITLSEEDKANFAQYWENGGYVEGYVYLENADEHGVDLNLPFLGFYGDWTQAPVFDTAYWYDNSFWGAGNGWPEGDEYHHVLWTTLAGTDYVLGFNPYAGPMVDNNNNIIYDAANNSVSPNGDGVIDGLEEIYLSLMRNAKVLTMTYANAETGEIYSQETMINNSKTMYRSSYGQVIPWIYSWYGNGMYRFTDAQGKTLPNGTKIVLTVDAAVDYGTGGTHTVQIPITVDTELPALLDAYQVEEEDGSHSLVIRASDNVNVAAIYLMNRSGSQIYGYDYGFTTLEDGSYVANFNVDGLGTELMIAVCDYAGNEAYYEINYTAAGENAPDMTPYSDLLFAYRVLDDMLYSDHMYGWVSLNQPASGDGYVGVSVWTDDYMEYAAINAAEYAGGKIFAVDAVHNLVVIQPGVWNRSIICNLGVNVLDMTFDDSTDTMYALVKADNEVFLCTLDLMTGELAVLAEYGYYNYAPYAITDNDNGLIIAIQYNKGNLFVLDANNEYALTPIEDAEGNELVILDADGNALKPNYAQSLAYVNGTVYWAYLNYSWMGVNSALYAIDLSTLTSEAFAYVSWAYDADYNVVEYYPNTELVGLLTLTDTEWQLPAAETLESLTMSENILVMAPGQNASLSVSATPWNYKLGQVEWTSSDASVVTVKDGKVTAVGEGEARITATSEGVSTSCNVVVVDTATTFSAYNYYSEDGYSGYMIDVDTGLMNYYLTAESPVDFIAGDYNGHEGFFYGYSEGGQFWRYDLESGEALKLGEPIGLNPSDMAYDYSTGIMYAITLDYMNGSTLHMVNMNNGELTEIFMPETYLMTLACGPDGTLYSITYDGTLLAFMQFYIEEIDEYYWDGMVVGEGLGELQYMQSMCYDYANNVIIWANPETACLYWIDMSNGYIIPLGDHTGAGIFELVGMYTVPAVIPELPAVVVEGAEVEDMMMLVGTTKTPDLTIYPFNATSKNVAWTSDNTAVVEITATGALKAVAAGTATVTGKLTDTVGGETYDLSFTVTVLPAADEVYGMVMTDIATYGGQYWIRLYATDPSDPDRMDTTSYVIYAEEYYDGKLYAYGFDPNDWSGCWQYFVMDPMTHEILDQMSMDEGFPFVYDMTYDYTTSTMYALAGPSDNAADLYAVDMTTGQLILVMTLDQFCMSVTASPDGTLYAIAQSQAEDEYSDVYANAQMYKLNPVDGTAEWFADTGIVSTMLASMAYDYDTGYIYWTALDSTNKGGLCLIDPATGIATNLGAIGGAGAQVSGLYIISENFPAEPDPSLLGVIMATEKAVVSVGGTTAIEAYPLPLSLDAEIVWTSSDESVVKVEDGILSGVAQGSAIVTATITCNGVTKSAECAVAVLAEDAAFLTWNRTDMGWSAISRNDYTNVFAFTAGEEIGVQAVDAVGNTVYGIDANGQLFKLNVEDFTRTAIGDVINADGIKPFLERNGLTEEDVTEDMFQFEVRDMAYDAANEQMLVLGSVLMFEEDFGEFSEMTGGNSIYSIDLTTGAMTTLYTFDEYYYVYGMAVDGEGNVFFYNGYDDHVCILDLTTGSYEKIVSLQSQSLYGDVGGETRQPMYYDELTNTLYLQLTGNNIFYQMLTIDPATGALVNEGYVGEVEMDYDTWEFMGDCYSGLVFVDLPEMVDVEYATISTTLNGQIGLNFYILLSQRIANDPSAYLEFTMGDKTVQIPVAEAKMSLRNGTERYCFTYELAAAEMTDAVTAQIWTENGPVGESKTYTVQKYADYVIENLDDEKLVNLMEAMLNYGAYAQIHFQRNLDNLANANLSNTTLPEAADLSAYAHSTTGEADGLTIKSFSLLLQSETTLRVYFALDAGKSIEDYTLTLDGEAITAKADDDGRYYVELADIPAAELDDMHEFNLGGQVLTCSALSYINQVHKYADSFSQDVLDMVNALYLYFVAAEAYFG